MALDASTLPESVVFMLNPEVYSHQVDKVDLVQTHISYVLLAGEYVYKIKKSVNFGFLDFGDLAKRRFFCDEELRLNQRLCPEIYLEVLAVTREADGALALAGSGEPVEYLVKMSRMPESGMMGNLIERGELTKQHLDLIISKLVPFYRRAEHGEDITALGSAESVGVNVLENFDQTRDFVGCSALSREQFDQIEAWSRDFLRREPLFKQRQQEGRICEGHGDLYSANICFSQDTERVFIFDCIEFNLRFRCCDVASDIAFLAMDLDLHGLDELSRYFVEQFKAQADDPHLSDLLPFYCCYRAYVRGKIGLFTAHAPEVDSLTKEKSLQQAGRYFALAQRYVQSS